MPTVNYLRVSDCVDDASYRNERYRKGERSGKEAYEDQIH